MEHSLNKLNNFKYGWYIDKKVCKDLIKYFNKYKNKTKGRVLYENTTKVNKNIKASTDVYINSNNNDTVIINYKKELTKVVNKYKEKYKYCDEGQDAWGLINPFNIQKYKPNEGYFKLHCEKSSFKNAERHLVFMTYLNDVSDGGETEFYYQKLKVKPETGLTLIWGSDWTFMHRGITSKTQTKYIATGWLDYIK